MKRYLILIIVLVILALAAVAAPWCASADCDDGYIATLIECHWEVLSHPLTIAGTPEPEGGESGDDDPAEAVPIPVFQLPIDFEFIGVDNGVLWLKREVCTYRCEFERIEY